MIWDVFMVNYQVDLFNVLWKVQVKIGIPFQSLLTARLDCSWHNSVQRLGHVGFREVFRLPIFHLGKILLEINCYWGLLGKGQGQLEWSWKIEISRDKNAPDPTRFKRLSKPKPTKNPGHEEQQSSKLWRRSHRVVVMEFICKMHPANLK